MKRFHYSFETTHSVSTSIGDRYFLVSGNLNYIEPGEYRAELTSVELLTGDGWVECLKTLSPKTREQLAEQMIEMYLAEIERKKRFGKD